MHIITYTPPVKHTYGVLVQNKLKQRLARDRETGAERSTAYCLPVHVDVHALGELCVAQAAALQEGARGRRRDRRNPLRRLLLAVVAGAVDHEGGLADDLRRRRCLPLPAGVALAVGLQENAQPGHGASQKRPRAE